jgi:hypothetical protein
MSTSRIAPALSLLAVLMLAACSASPAAAPASPTVPPAPSATPSTPEAVVSPEPSVAPPAATPAPVSTPAPATPRPTQRPLTDVEFNLRAGIQRGTENCLPVDGDDLPDRAVAGIECDGTDPAVARLGFYLFENDQDMIDAYLARMKAEGVKLDSGTCADGEAERPYVPGEGLVLERTGCFLNEQGFANYRYTIPGNHVYVGILGTSADMRALEDFAWIGNQDVPGIPTLWSGGID